MNDPIHDLEIETECDRQVNRELLVTLEIVLAVVAPLLFLYLKSNWRLPCTWKRQRRE